MLSEKNPAKKLMRIFSINQFKSVSFRNDLPSALYSTLAATVGKTIHEWLPQLTGAALRVRAVL